MSGISFGSMPLCSLGDALAATELYHTNKTSRSLQSLTETKTKSLCESATVVLTQCSIDSSEEYPGGKYAGSFQVTS